MSEAARAVVLGWQQAVDAAWNRQHALLGLRGGVDAGSAARIIGGREAQSAPWAAFLSRNGGDVKLQATASIIAPKWLLTAAHTVKQGQPNEYTFHIGDVDRTKGEVRTAKAIYLHPTADLALVELDHEVQAKEFARLGDPLAVQPGDTAQIYGWGITNPLEAEAHQKLKVADVKVDSTDAAVTLNDPLQPEISGTIKVLAVDGTPARGDSGGPIMVTRDGQSYLVGVCTAGDEKFVAAYTDVTRHRDWIKAIAGV